MIHNKQTNQLSIAESGSYINTVYNSRKVKSSKNMIKEHKSRKEVEVYVATSQVHADIHTNRFQKLTNLSEMKIPQLRYKLSISNIHSTLLLPSSSIVTQEKEAHNTQHWTLYYAMLSNKMPNILSEAPHKYISSLLSNIHVQSTKITCSFWGTTW